jgi:ABC-type amino acid transport system permease subunit
MSSIQPLQNILGGGLYKSMKSAGSAAKSHEKVQEEKPQNSLLAELIAAALACAAADAELIGDLLDANEISKIENALMTGTTYTSTIMPASFVQCVNNIIPTFRAAKGIV